MKPIRTQSFTANEKQDDNLRLISSNINMEIGSFCHFSEFSFFWFYYAQKWLFNGDQSYLRPPEIILRSDIDDLFYNTVWNISNGVVT